MQSTSCSQLRIKLAEIKSLKEEVWSFLNAPKENFDSAEKRRFIEAKNKLEDKMCELRKILFGEMMEKRNEIFNIINCNFVGKFHGGLARIKRGSGTWGYIDKNGKIAVYGYREKIPPVNEMGYGFTSNIKEIASVVKYNDDIKRSEIFNKMPMDVAVKIATYDTKKEDWRWKRDDDGWYYMDAEKKNNLTEAFDEHHPFSNGFARVKKDGKYFFINKNGERLSGENFDEAHEFSCGSALVRKGNDRFFINNEGKNIFGEKYANAKSFSEWFAAVQDEKGGPWHFIDRYGKRHAFGPYWAFHSAESFEEGVAEVQIYESGSVRFIDHDGEPGFRIYSTQEDKERVMKKFNLTKLRN